MGFFVATLLASLLSLNAQAQGHIPELAARIHVDGVLNEAAWSQALVVELPYEVEPGEGAPAPVRTTALLFSTSTSLYVGFHARDPRPQEIRAHFADRDQFFRDDFVGVILDTFADQRRAYQFFVNPLGVQGDSLRTITGEGEQEDITWDAIWHAAGKLSPEGYTVEMAIPFAALRFPSGSQEKRIGFAALRMYPRSLRRLLFSVALDRNNSCLLCQLPVLVGLTSATPGRSLELVPTWVVLRQQEREDIEAPRLNEPTVQSQAGLSLLWGLTPSITLAGTMNPDFSQVEADSKKLAINRVFSLFFPEKRPFFLEGADAFATLLNAVYTRTMADPDWGVKLVGRTGKSTMGILAVRDQLTPLVLPGTQSSQSLTLSQPSTASAGRWRYDASTKVSLGLLATDRRGGDLATTLGGLDGLFRLSKNTTLAMQWLYSSSRYPQDPKLSGLSHARAEGAAWLANVSHASRKLEAWAEAKNIKEGFRADLGFVPQVGIRGAEVGAQRVWRGSDGDWYATLRIGGEVERWEDQRGNMLEERQRATARYEGPLQSTVVVSLARFQERWQQDLFSGFSGRAFANIRFTGNVTASLSVEGGDAVDYQGNRPAKKWAFSPGFTWNIGRRVYLQGHFLAENLAVAEGRLYRAYLAETRLLYHLGVRSFLRLITQYSLVRTSPQLSPNQPQSVSREWAHQVLFAYKLNPQTLVFFGGSESTAGDFRRSEVTLHRSVFLKLSLNLQV